ncbi:heterokaryon incompatibility protein-domain-containing protein [Xylaria digitata]|nr:heterokaryon incompatibility protein-domain-containing protein [Xylaria digitata]
MAYIKLQETISRFLLRVYTYGSRRHVYRILDQSNSGIRLLKVRSVQSVWGFKSLALVNAELISCPINSAPPFVAVSYRWEANKSMLIMIGNRRFDAPRTIYDLLIVLQSEALSHQPQDETYFWIDSNCINQRDTKEKSWQIGLMKDVYRSATHVLCWLGAAASPISTWRGIEGVRDAAEIICNDFFFRAWIIQEISLARKIVMRTRNDSCSWDDGLVGMCRDQGPAFSLYGENEFGLPVSIMPRVEQGIKNMRGMESFRMSLMERPDGLPISELLVRSVEFRCSDARDRVYSLLGLTTEKARSAILMKYHRSYSELNVSMQALRFSLIGESSFRLLEMSGIGAGDRGSFSPGANNRATWVPDWRSSQIARMARTLTQAKSHTTATHRRCRVMPPTGTEDRTLCIEGAAVDTVKEMMTTTMVLPKTCDFRDEQSRNKLFPFLDNFDLMCETARKAGEGNLDGEWRTHDAIMRTMLSAGSLIKDESPDFVKLRNDIETLSTRLRSRLAKAKDQVQRSSVAEMNFKHFLMGLEEFMPLLIGRRFCSTGKGGFGIMPPGTEVGDEVCAFSGAPNPFVLRSCSVPRSSTPDMYQIIGVCSVDEPMRGAGGS